MSVKLLLIDNYDSFTYNLVQAFLVLGADVQVHRNDAITVDDFDTHELRAATYYDRDRPDGTREAA